MSGPAHKARCGPATRLLAAAALAAGLAGCTSDPLTYPVLAYRDIAYVGVTRQLLDFSCGAASMATLLNSYYGETFTEADLLRIVRDRYDPAAWAKKRDEGLSFDDLIYIAHQVGYEAEGAQIGLAGLLKANGPVIVHLDKGAFKHFTVLRGFAGGAALLADPATGRTRYSPAEFVGQYSGYALAVWKPGEDLPDDHLLAVRETEAGQERLQVRQALFDRYEGSKTPF